MPGAKEIAMSDLVASGIRIHVPSFSMTSIIKAKKGGVTIRACLDDIYPKRTVNGITEIQYGVFGMLGSMAARSTFKLQNLRRAPATLTENDFNFSHEATPKPGEDLYFTGKVVRNRNNIYRAKFAVRTVRNGQDVFIGFGTMSLSKVMARRRQRQKQTKRGSRPTGIRRLRGLRFLAIRHRTRAATSHSSKPVGLASVPLSLSTPAPAAPVVLQMKAAVLNNERPPMTKRRPPAPVQAVNVAPAGKAAIDLRSAAATTSRAQPPTHRRPVLPVAPTPRMYKYMYANVESRHPAGDTKWKEELVKLGVEPKDVTHRSFPIRRNNRFIFYFSVTRDEEVKMSALMMKGKDWITKFSTNLNGMMRKHSFLMKSMDIEQVVEAMFLAQKSVAAFARGGPMKDDLKEQLADKRNIKSMIQNREMRNEVYEKLSAEGKRIFDEKVKPAASRPTPVLVTLD